MLVVVGSVLTAAQAQRIYQYLSLLDWSAQFTLLVLGTIGLFEVLLPAATFLAVLYVFRTAWRRGYVSTLFSCGYSPWRLNRGLIQLTAIIMACTALFSHYLGPMALNQLKLAFVEAFQSGNVHPITAIPLGEGGGLEIAPENGEVLGVFQSMDTLNLVHAEQTKFVEINGSKRVQFNGVHAANKYVSLETDTLTIALGPHSFSSFPKVLRGTKLISTDKLTLENRTHQYATLRRLTLTLLVVPLLLLAGLLPRFFGDVALVCVSGLCLACTHVTLRFIELSNLDGIALFIVMFAFILSTYGVTSWALWRTFWRI
jgi:lipopolysaccharide export LptBFGC system permease protein LptF